MTTYEPTNWQAQQPPLAARNSGAPAKHAPSGDAHAGQRSRRLRRISGAVLLALAASAAAVFPTATSAAAYGGDTRLQKTIQSTRLQNCPNRDAIACTAGARSLPAGTKVKVICGERGPGYEQFVFVRTSGGSEGFIPAARIEGNPNRYFIPAAQPAPGCSAIDRIEAMRYATRRVGSVYAPTGMETAMGGWTWAPGPRREFSGDCVFLAKGVWAASSGTRLGVNGNANDIGRQLANAGRLSTSNRIPAGALVFWDFGQYGHVAVALGRAGLVVGTQGYDNDRLPVRVHRIADLPGYMGWMVPS